MVSFDLNAVTVVIPNWNGARFLRPLLDDLRVQTAPPLRVLVVDNGSADDSATVVAEAGAELLPLHANRGFAAAVNAGVRSATTNLVAILNNDLRLSPDWMDRLLAGMADKHSFATGKILSGHQRNIIDGTWDEISRGGTAWRCGAGRPDSPLWSKEADVRIPTFTAVLLRRNYYLELNGLDERFVSYLEDVDFGIRSASEGHNGSYVPSAVSYHLGSGTLGRWHPQTVRQVSRNQVRLVAKHYSRRALRRFGWQIAVAQLLWGAVAIRRGAGWPWVAGKLEGLRTFREHAGEELPNLETVLEESERRIRHLQSAAGWDTYWRLYFALT